MFAVMLGQCEYQPLIQLPTDGNRVEVTYFNQRNQPFKMLHVILTDNNRLKYLNSYIKLSYK